MIGKIFAELYKAYGDQQWWAAYSPFEVMIAALLAQHTNQSYRKLAIAQLKQHKALTPETLSAATETQLVSWIKATEPPVEHVEYVGDIEYVEKAQQIKLYSQWYLEQGSFESLERLDMLALRTALLTLEGMDKETADIILLYAFERPVFIIDEDMRRIFYRLELINGDEPHDELRHIMALSIDQDAVLFNEYHALLAKHAVVHCRQHAHCEGCPLDKICPE